MRIRGRNILSKTNYTLRPLGETCLLVTFGNQISPKIHKQLKNFADYLEQNIFIGLREYVISYTSIAVFYNPFIIINNAADKSQSAYEIVSNIAKEYIANAKKVTQAEPRTVEIPVCYGDEFGPDIDFVAQYNHLSCEEVIKIHSAKTYLVYMIGFCPGFPYLGGMDERIATPRKDEPRLHIPVGSIGIAGKQTGGYPLSTPGGWQLIGRTPVDLFLPEADDPSFLHSGDLVKFVSISQREYNQLKGDSL